jgi:hypothetical protein
VRGFLIGHSPTVMQRYFSKKKDEKFFRFPLFVPVDWEEIHGGKMFGSGLVTFGDKFHLCHTEVFEHYAFDLCQVRFLPSS